MSVPNYLSAVEFKFVIERLPNVEFYVQRANVPGISSGFTTTTTPFKNLYGPGDKLEFDDLTLEVIVDENMSSYIETWQWLASLSRPEGFEGYAALEASDRGIYSDATLFIMSNAKNPNIRIKFKDLFPISVGEINLDTTAGDVDPPTTAMTFKFLSYEIEVIG